MGGRNQSERLVAINRNQWSQSPGARKEALNEKFEIRVKGKIRTITAREGIVWKLINEALNGNIKATAVVLAKEPEMARNADPLKMITRDMSPQEAAAAYAQTLKR